MLGPHAGLWLSLRTLGISHMLAIVPAAFEAEILILTKIWYSDQRLASGTDQARQCFEQLACLFLPTPSSVVFLSLSFTTLYNSPLGRALASLHP